MSEKVFFHTAHKALWNWLSINTDQVKANWPGWSYNGGVISKVIGDCFACEFCSDCDDCPILWKKDGTCMLSEYGQWVEAKNERKSNSFISKLAAQIRDLPVREGVVCK